MPCPIAFAKAGGFIYSRYIPREGGGFERQPLPQPTPQDTAAPEPARHDEPPRDCPRHPEPPPQKQNPPPGKRTDILSALQQALGRGFDAGDLLILLILVLILVDSKEDQLGILLTIGFFLVL